MVGTRLTADSELSLVLEILTSGLQITKTQYDRASTAYDSITGWLGEDGSPLAGFDPLLFPQGSLRLGTTVKPLKKSEFDLDIVCLLKILRPMTPGEVYELVWQRMWAHGTYRAIMERMPRCIRLNYSAESQFHLDIVPAVPDVSKGRTYILIPDRPDPELTTWKTTNPKGYAFWFERQMVLLEKYARWVEVEPLPTPVPATEKAALTKAVQLLKRWRDVRFKEDMDLAPSSIILTTLGGEQYTGQQICSDALTNILEGMVAFARSNRRSLYNPANAGELISEKWVKDDRAYRAFCDRIVEFRDKWQELLAAARSPIHGMGDVAVRLRELFGEPAVAAVKAVSERIRDARSNGALYVEKQSGSIITATPAASIVPSVVKVRSNTFYGE